MEEFNILIDELMVKMFYMEDAVSKVPRDYTGCGILLHPSDIHMIEAIGKHSDANNTELSQIMGITKGTVSKMTKKLVKIGLVKQYKIVDNKKEVYYMLTELGRKAFDGHYKFHESRTANIDEEFNSYTDEQKECIINFIKKYTEELSQYTN